MNKNDISFSDNSFDILRLIAAMTVVWGHTSTHLQVKSPDIISHIMLPFPGVPIFFAISGYLITASYERCAENGGIKKYFKSRMFRIYPAMWFGFLLTVVTIIMLYPINASFAQIFTWLFTQLTLFQFYTPEFLRGFGVGTPNGSLWTITIELQFYFLVPFICKIVRRCSMMQWITILICAPFLGAPLLFVLRKMLLPDLAYKLTSATIFPYLYIFLIGIFIYMKQNIILPVLVKYYYMLLGGYLLFHVINYKLLHISYGSGINIISGTFIGFLAAATAYKLGRHRLKADISYGVYIYHMIIVNVFVELNLIKNIWIFICSLALTICFGFISWYGIEKPFLRLKDKT